MVEAGVPRTRAPRRLGIDVLEVLDDRVHRGVQAVEVEAVEADLGRARRQFAIPLPQPAEEGDDGRVPPHPGWEAVEVGESLLRALVVALAAHEAVHARGIGPVRLGCDCGEAALDDQALRELGPLPVELLRSVRGLAEEREAGAGSALDERVVVPGPVQRPNGFGERAHSSRALRASNSRTSSSVVGAKSWYQSPTAWKGCGVTAH